MNNWSHSDSDTFRLRHLSDHVVICGLGRKGAALARSFHDQGYRVVAIESDDNNDEIESCKEYGVIVLNGDGADRDNLEKVRVDRARYIIAVCGDDGANWEKPAVAGRHAMGEISRKVRTEVNDYSCRQGS